MKIHYFYKREYNSDFYDLVTRAWLEEKETSRQGMERLSPIRLEELRIFLSKDDHSHCYDLKHEPGKNSCIGHFARTHKKLKEDTNKWKSKPIDWHNCERFWKIALAPYRKRSLIDFFDFKGR